MRPSGFASAKMELFLKGKVIYELRHGNALA